MELHQEPSVTTSNGKKKKGKLYFLWYRFSSGMKTKNVQRINLRESLVCR